MLSLGHVSHICLLSPLMINNDCCCWKNANASDDRERKIQTRPTSLGLLPIPRSEEIPRTVTACVPEHRSNPEQASTNEWNAQKGAVRRKSPPADPITREQHRADRRRH